MPIALRYALLQTRRLRFVVQNQIGQGCPVALGLVPVPLGPLPPRPGAPEGVTRHLEVRRWRLVLELADTSANHNIQGAVSGVSLRNRPVPSSLLRLTDIAPRVVRLFCQTCSSHNQFATAIGVSKHPPEHPKPGAASRHVELW